MTDQDPKKDIAEFLAVMSEKYGRLPKFAHNLVAKDPKKVYYSDAYFDDNELVAAIDTFLFGKWSSSVKLVPVLRGSSIEQSTLSIHFSVIVALVLIFF